MSIEDLLIKFGEKMSSFMDEEKAFIARARVENPWFTEKSVAHSALAWSKALSKENIIKWLKAYELKKVDKRIGIIMAGNIPWVGLHDLLCAITCQSKVICKMSSNDAVLMKWAIITLNKIAPELEIEIAKSRLSDIDVLIGTGSNNSARYFEYYFKDKPKVIRKNRSSVAIIDDKTSNESLALLANDIFTYYGLGCRNVGKVFLPRGYDLPHMIDAFEAHSEIQHHHKYYNNYTYHKAILLMNLDKHLDNGFLLLQEKDEELKPPLSQLFYAFYDSKEQLINKLKTNEEIQCAVGEGKDLIPFGEAQTPALTDYADNVDTVDFLLGL